MTPARKQVSAAEAVAMIRGRRRCRRELLLRALLSRMRCWPRLGDRFDATGAPRDLTTIHPIAAGDIFGTKGVDHIAKPGCIARIIGGSYPSGPTNAEPPLIWQMITGNEIKAYNVPSGIVFDMLREAAANRPGVLTKVGMDTFVDPDQDGCAMNDAARADPIVRRETFDGEDWLYFPAIAPDVAIIRATTADQRGNLSFESEGAYLGAMEMALAAHNRGGMVIAQVRRVAQNGSIRPHDVHVPGILVDMVVEAPDDAADHGNALRPGDLGRADPPARQLSRPPNSAWPR